MPKKGMLMNNTKVMLKPGDIFQVVGKPEINYDFKDGEFYCVKDITSFCYILVRFKKTARDEYKIAFPYKEIVLSVPAIQEHLVSRFSCGINMLKIVVSTEFYKYKNFDVETFDGAENLRIKLCKTFGLYQN